jgi:hypothetical protein
VPAPEAPAAAPKRRTTRKPAAASVASGEAAPVEASSETPAEAPKRRTTRKKAEPAEA